MVKRAKPKRPDGTIQIGVRTPAELVRQIDAFADAKARETGLRVSRTDAVLYLVRLGLGAERKKP